MKIFIDQCVHQDTIFVLRKAGFEVQSALEAKLNRASDEEIFKYAVKNKFVLLTFDHDFGNIIRFDIKKSHGVVLFHIEGLQKTDLLEKIVAFFEFFKKQKVKNKLFVIDIFGQVRTWPKDSLGIKNSFY